MSEPTIHPASSGSARAPLTPSERAVLDVIRRHEPVPRADITAHVDLAQQTVHRIVEGLSAAGLVKAGAPLRRGRGQPSAVLALAREAAYSVGVSVNTDSIVLTLVDLACRTVEEVTLRQAPVSRAASLAEVDDTLKRILRRNGIDRGRIVGMGVAVSGFFVPGGGINAPEPLQDWSLTDLKPELARLFGLPIWLENNATTGAIGEKMRGAGLWAQTFAYISFNYGFGMGFILDGRPYFGVNRNAGEARLYAPDGEGERRPALRYLIDELRRNGIAIDSVADLRDRFDPTWPGVETWIERIMPQLDRAVNIVAGLFDPEAIVFGGQIPPELGRILIARTRYWPAHRYGVEPATPKLILSEANGDPAATGAALLPLDALFFP